MVKRGHSPTAAVCSIIRSRPRGIRRSGSRASLDVKGSYVMKKIWLFEGLDECKCNIISYAALDFGELNVTNK